MHHPQVIINGHQLSHSQLEDLQLIYGIEPQTGAYWYDQVSGMYGLIGEGISGFMYSEHQFGEMYANCSDGNTGVFLNGRELPHEEWLVWSQVLGAYIQPGAYWFDRFGNIGLEGDAHPVANLYLTAKQQTMAAGQSTSAFGGSQGNFWSSRFSAGNSNAGNTQGYVSVPGHGPVGYGF